MRRRAAGWAVGATAAAVVLAAACGNDQADVAGPTTTTTAATSTTAGGTATSTTAVPAAPGVAAVPPPDQRRLDGVRVSLHQLASLNTPVALTARPGDANVYVAERDGRVQAVTPDGSTHLVLDITGDVGVRGEGGLLGVALSPDGQRLYVSYTDTGDDSRLVEYRMSGSAADPASRRDILTVNQPATVHNGGAVAFGPDGMLWWSLGDGGVRTPDGRMRAQELDTLLGSIVRIDPTPAPDGHPYQIPAGNPFVDQAGARPEIWAYGLRNPWRFSFDRATGDLWIGDVGEFAMEEIDLLPAGPGGVPGGAGANFGWPYLEGDRRLQGEPPAGLVDPLHTYGHSRGRCAITGGYVYRGRAIPDLAGAYLFADLCEGSLMALSAAGEGGGRTVTAQRSLGPRVEQTPSFGEDASGELYVLSLAGHVYKLVPG